MNRLMPDKASSNTRLSIIISRGEFLAPKKDTTDSVEPVGLKRASGKMVTFGLFASNLRDSKFKFEMEKSKQTSQTTWAQLVPSRECWTDDAPLQLGEP